MNTFFGVTDEALTAVGMWVLVGLCAGYMMLRGAGWLRIAILCAGLCSSASARVTVDISLANTNVGSALAWVFVQSASGPGESYFLPGTHVVLPDDEYSFNGVLVGGGSGCEIALTGLTNANVSFDGSGYSYFVSNDAVADPVTASVGLQSGFAVGFGMLGVLALVRYFGRGLAGVDPSTL